MKIEEFTDIFKPGLSGNAGRKQIQRLQNKAIEHAQWPLKQTRSRRLRIKKSNLENNLMLSNCIKSNQSSHLFCTPYCLTHTHTPAV